VSEMSRLYTETSKVDSAFYLRGTVKWVVTHLHGLRKVGTLVQLTGVA